jgi:hypothetical protein
MKLGPLAAQSLSTLQLESVGGPQAGPPQDGPNGGSSQAPPDCVHSALLWQHWNAAQGGVGQTGATSPGPTHATNLGVQEHAEQVATLQSGRARHALSSVMALHAPPRSLLETLASAPSTLWLSSNKPSSWQPVRNPANSSAQIVMAERMPRHDEQEPGQARHNDLTVL